MQYSQFTLLFLCVCHISASTSHRLVLCIVHIRFLSCYTTFAFPCYSNYCGNHHLVASSGTFYNNQSKSYPFRSSSSTSLALWNICWYDAETHRHIESRLFHFSCEQFLWLDHAHKRSIFCNHMAQNQTVSSNVVFVYSCHRPSPMQYRNSIERLPNQFETYVVRHVCLNTKPSMQAIHRLIDHQRCAYLSHR